MERARDQGVALLKLWLAFLAASAAASAPDTAPRFLNMQEVFTGQDYPLSSLRNDEEGTVGVKLRVDSAGAVESCKVIESSGHSALDAQTCALFRARARFSPKYDGHGSAVASDVTQKIVWKLAGPKPQPMPRQAWMIRTRMSLTKSGRIVGCKIDSTGLATPPQDCAPIMAIANAASDSTSKVEPVAGFIISDIYFYPVDVEKAPTAPKLAEAHETGREIIKLTIAPDGSVAACETVRHTGAASPDQDVCAMVRSQRFDPAPAGQDLRATVVFVGYVERNSVT